MDTVVVVGASLAGLRCCEALRRRGYSGKLVLVGEEAHKPYDRPPLSKQVLCGEWEPARTEFRRKEGYAPLALELQLGRRALALHAQARRVVLDDGKELAYDGLVIATGARARTLRGSEALSGVFTLRTLDDALQLRVALLQQPRVVVVGAGFIGLEVASACRKLDVAVTVVESMALPLDNPLGSAVGQAVQRLHEAHGVSFRLGVGVAALEGHGRVEHVRLSDGTAVPADVVVVGIGVTPNTAWLEGSGVAVGDGVLCDPTLATSVPGVVAAGDVVRWENPLFGESMRVEHWSNAVEQGQAAAARLLAGPTGGEPFSSLPYFWSDQYDLKLQFAGRVRADDELVLVEGTLADRNYVALYGRAGKLRGVLASNRPQQLLRYRKLLSEQASFDAALNAARPSAGP